MRVGILSVLALVLALLSFAARAEDRDVTTLTGLIEARLALQPGVAQAKWNTQAAIDDPEREQRILDGLAVQAKARGLPAAWVAQFFRAQIEAGKIVQRDLFARWKREKAGHFDAAPNLKNQIRPQLDALTPQLLDALVAVWPRLAQGDIPPSAWQLSNTGDLSPLVVTMALGPLRDGRAQAAP